MSFFFLAHPVYIPHTLNILELLVKIRIIKNQIILLTFDYFIFLIVGFVGFLP